MSEDLVLLQAAEGIATVTINRPKQMNALNVELLLRLRELLLECGARDDVRVVILTGAGEKSFVAGADIAAMREMSPRQALAFAELGQSVFNTVEALPKPVIAAVNGFALGGGCELAISCDIILASERAKFGTPEVNLGVFPGFGGTQRLPRLLGKARAKEVIFTGEMFDAARALAIGLINRICPPGELMGEAMNLARTIMAKGPVAVGLAKQSIDQKEGMTAFLEKREAKFQGR